MTIALLVLSLLAPLAVAGLVVHGFLVRSGASPVLLHVDLAAPIIVFAMLAHTMAIFYFIGTGKQIKDLSREHSLDGRYAREARAFKKRVFPAATGAIVLLIATFVAGGGVYVGAIPGAVHLLLALLTLLVGAVAAFLEVRAIYRNVLLAERLTQDLECLSDPPDPDPGEGPPGGENPARARSRRALRTEIP